MATPSLAMIPSGYKASKVYSVLPESGVGDFGFTRATTATRVNSSGLIEEMAINVPRLEYPLIDGVVNGCPSLLLEPQRTNEIAYSNDISDVYWLKSISGSGVAPIVTSNYAISPDGTQNADRIQFDATTSGSNSDRSRIRTTLSLSDATDYTFSFYAKSTGGSDQKISILFDNSQIGVVTVTSEWQRFEGTNSQIGTNSICGLDLRGGTASTSDILVYGVQVEAGSYATSYIPTNGSTVTRNAETCTGAGDAATFNDSEGVLMVEISALADDLTQKALGISDGTTSNRMSIVYNDGSSNALRMFVTNPSGTKSYITNSFNITQNNKISIKLNGTSLAFWVNGFEIHTNTLNSAFVNGTLNTLDFAFNNNNTPFYGKTKQVQYYNSALTDSELEKLTSWTSFSDMANGQQYSII